MCLDPLTQVADRAILTVFGYHNPALEGHTVNFSCSFGEVITGSNTSICTRNGKWEPDPKEISCDNNMITTIIPNSQQFQIMNVLVGSLLGSILLLITVTTIIVAFLVKGRVKGL